MPERLRGERALRHLVAACCAALVVLGVGSALVGQAVFAGVDLVTTRAPWTPLPDGRESAANVWVADTVDAVLPSADVLRDGLLEGDLVRWNPYQNGGSDLTGTLGTGLWSPLSLPYWVLPTWLAPAWVKVLEVAVTVLGCVLLGRALGMRPVAGWLCGLVLPATGFVVGWTNWPQTRTAAVLPLLLWATERLVVAPSARRAAVLSLVVAAAVLGGFPAVTAWAFALCGLYAACRLLARRGPLRRPGRAVLRDAVPVAGAGVLAVLLGVALTAAVLLPFVAALGDNVDFDVRAQTPDRHVPTISLLQTFAPTVLGGVQGPADPWYGPRNPVESASYLGPAACVLVLVGACARRRPGWAAGARPFLVAASAVMLLLIYVGGTPLALAQQLPVFDTNDVGRLRAVLFVCLALLAGHGFDALLRPPEQPRLRPVLVAARVVVGTAVVLAAAALALEAQRFSAEQLGGALDVGTPVREGVALVALAALVATVAVLSRGRPLGALALLSVPLMVLGQGASVVRDFWPRVDRAEYYPQAASLDLLQDRLGHDRYVPLGTGFPGVDAVYDLRSLVGHSFTDPGYRQLLRDLDPESFRSPTWVRLPADPALLGSPLLDRAAVRFASVGAGAEVPGRLVDGALDEAGALALVDLGEADATPPEGADVRGLRFALGPAAAGTEVSATRPGQATSVARAAADGSVWLPLVEGLPGPVRVRLAEGSPVDVADVAASWVVDPGDGLEVVHVGDATVYERTTALPRIRWAGTAVAAGDDPLALVADGTVQAGQVLVEDPGGSGADAEVAVLEDEPDVVRVAVEAQGEGYLVVADSVVGSFRAVVDGRPVELVRADGAFAAVRVPEGRHEVVLEHDVPGQDVGAWVSAGAGAALLGCLLPRRRRRSGGRHRHRGGPGGPDAAGRAPVPHQRP